jgi:type IV secretory pathway TraG/TraD family ATPase VirD4
MSSSHRTTDLLFLGYALTAAGVLAGRYFSGATLLRMIASPLYAILTFLIAMIVFKILGLIFGFDVTPGPSRYVSGPQVDEWFRPLYFFIFGVVAGRGLAGPSTVLKRGTLLEPAIRNLFAGPRKGKGVTLAGQPVDPADETKHFKMIGTTGTGKSTAIFGLLAGALQRGDRAIIADPDGSYLNAFYDPKKGDQILNPFDARAARWDLFAEMHTPHDADQLARSLIADTEGTERNWRQYARVFLSSVLRQLHRVNHNDPAELYRLLSTTPVNDLRDLLEDTPAGPYLTQDNGKFFGAVRAVANTHLAALEQIAQQTRGDRLSVRNWVRVGQGGRRPMLFLPYHANEIATLRGLISTWMRLAIYETMSQRQREGEGGAPADQRLWFIIDELDALGPIDGLKDALARLRKFGGRCVLGFQSIAQVSGTYGHAEAQTIVENCGNTLILRCSSSENGGTARFASKLIGEREITREHVTTNDGGGMFSRGHASTSKSLQHVTESAVLPSEIEQLPDLEGYLKFASKAEWRRVKLRLPF